MSADLLITLRSPLPLDTVCRQLAESAVRHQFGVLATHNLREKIEGKGLPFGRECRVIEVCNPRQAQQVLSESITVATALPCRVAVYEENGQTVMATIKPSLLLTMFDAPGAAPVARDVEATLVRIMEEAGRAV
jgi:uncharacterized protein (DUF302 family)